MRGAIRLARQRMAAAEVELRIVRMAMRPQAARPVEFEEISLWHEFRPGLPPAHPIAVQPADYRIFCQTHATPNLGSRQTLLKQTIQRLDALGRPGHFHRFPPYTVDPPVHPTTYGTMVVAPWQEVSISWSRAISIAAIAQHFGEICRNALERGEPRAPQPIEIFTQIALVVRLVKGKWEELQRCVVIGFVAGLQRVHEDQSAARPQHTADLGHGGAPNRVRQL